MRHPLTLRRASVGLAFTVEVLPHPVDSGQRPARHAHAMHRPVLLFAQPAFRITQLTLNDITIDTTGTTFLRLGDPPVPVPAPFAALLRQAAASPVTTWPQQFRPPTTGCSPARTRAGRAGPGGAPRDPGHGGDTRIHLGSSAQRATKLAVRATRPLGRACAATTG